MTATDDNVVSLATPEQLREDTRRLMESLGLSQNKAAAEAGVHATTFSSWLNGTYKGDNPKVARQVETWIRSRRERETVAAYFPPRPGWVRTPTSDRIWDALRYAHQLGDIAVIYGGAGVGKSTTIGRYRDQHPNVWLVTVAPATASVGVMLQEVAFELGLKDLAPHPAKLQREILRRIDGTNGLIVIDEAQHLTKQGLEELRSLHDRSGLGLTLSGNSAVYQQMYRGGDNGFAQIFSRVGMRVPLARPKVGDIRAVAVALGAESKAVMKLLEEIGVKPGGLRGVVKAWRLAVVLAGGQAVAVEHVRAAWRQLQGDIDSTEAA